MQKEEAIFHLVLDRTFNIMVQLSHRLNFPIISIYKTKRGVAHLNCRKNCRKTEGSKVGRKAVFVVTGYCTGAEKQKKFKSLEDGHRTVACCVVPLLLLSWCPHLQRPDEEQESHFWCTEDGLRALEWGGSCKDILERPQGQGWSIFHRCLCNRQF